MKKRFIFTVLIFVCLCFSTYAQSQDATQEEVQDIIASEVDNPIAKAESIINDFRDKVYSHQYTAAELVKTYARAAADFQITLKNYDLCSYYGYVARNEYFMGRAYQYEEKNDKAAEHYAIGITLAEQSLEIKNNVLGLLMKAECISQSCAVRSTSYAIANGLKIGDLAEEILKLEPNNSAAMYLQAGRYIYAPGFLADQKKGRKMLQNIINVCGDDMPADDAFNVYSSMGYSFILSGSPKEAITWLKKSQEFYPTNQFVAGLLKDIK